MRNPPPVSVLTRSGGGWRAAQALLHALAAAAFTAWAGLHAGWGGAGHAELFAVVAVAAIGAAALGWRLSRDNAQMLTWTGEGWRLGEADIPPPQCVADLGQWMLLKANSRWLVTSSRLAPEAWHGFRAAVYSAPFRPTPGLSSEHLPY